MRKYLIAAAFVMSANVSAEAAPRLCHPDRDGLLEQFEEKYGEVPRAMGLGRDGGVIEVLVSPDGGFTMIITYPGRPTCVIAAGEAWEILPIKMGDPA